MLPREKPTAGQQELVNPARHQLTANKTRRRCGAPKHSSAPEPALFSQSIGPPQQAPQRVAAQWRGGSYSRAFKVFGPALPAVAVTQVANSCARAVLRARPNQSLKRRPTTAGHRAGKALHVYHRPRRPGVPPQRSA